MKNDNDPLVDIVIVGFNCQEEIRKCLKSLGDQSKDFRVVVCENGNPSSASTYQPYISCAVEVHNMPGNLGFGAASNFGLKSGNADYVLFLNPDTRVEFKVIENLVKKLDSLPEVGIIGCLLTNDVGDIDAACNRKLPNIKTALKTALNLSINREKKVRETAVSSSCSKYYEPGYVEAINGAFMLCKRETVERVKGFDERFWMYGEDLDLCLRVAQSGSLIYYDPSEYAIHRKSAVTGRHRSLKVNYHFHLSMYIYYKLHLRRNYFENALVVLGISARFAITQTKALIAGIRSESKCNKKKLGGR